jgi:hypothetical protein
MLEYVLLRKPCSRLPMCQPSQDLRLVSLYGHPTDGPQANGMSALPLTGDMCGAAAHVSFGPIADIDITVANKKPPGVQRFRPEGFLATGNKLNRSNGLVALPSPAEQTKRAETGGKKRKCSGKGRGDLARDCSERRIGCSDLQRS